MSTGEILKELGVGLSRIIRYCYGGVLLLVLLCLFDTSREEVRKIVEAITPALTIVAILGMGAFLYILHRCTVIPVFHLMLTRLLRLGDNKNDTRSPTYLLKKLGAKKRFGIIAYTTLRRSDFFRKKRDEINLLHAEGHVMIMTGTGLFITFFCDYYFPCHNKIHWTVFLFSGIIFWLISFIPAWLNHSMECRIMKKDFEGMKKTLENWAVPFDTETYDAAVKHITSLDPQSTDSPEE